MIDFGSNHLKSGLRRLLGSQDQTGSNGCGADVVCGENRKATMINGRKCKRTTTKTPLVGTPDLDVAADTSQTFHHSGERRLRLLLIEDHVALAEATSDWLREMGMEVRIAGTGNEGLEVAAAFRPDIVVCDMCLPDISGLDVAQRLNANGEPANVFFVMHTAFGDADIRMIEEAADPRNVQMCLSKPITKEKLDRLLCEFAARSRVTDTRERTRQHTIRRKPARSAKA
jgi:CheY-like chemotaxis protein